MQAPFIFLPGLRKIKKKSKIKDKQGKSLRILSVLGKTYTPELLLQVENEMGVLDNPGARIV